MLETLFKSAPDKLPLVVAINGVDKIGPGDWDEKLNAPSREQETSIRSRCEDISKKLAALASISADHIEYYSALRRYRLVHLLIRIIQFGKTGFKMDSVCPRDPFELADVEVRKFADEERRRRASLRPSPQSGVDQLRTAIESVLPPKDLANIDAAFERERSRPPKIAFFGKAGVGKTTTINNLLNAQWKTSHSVPGTTEAQIKEFQLDTGGAITVVDLPGYGRSIREDKQYEEIYKTILPDCDVVLLIVQANARDLADDQEMVNNVAGWLKASPVTKQ